MGIDWVKIVKDVLVVLIPVVILIFAQIIHSLLVALLNRIKNPSIRNLATQAVLWAKDKFGPDGSGKVMLAAAVEYLSSKTGISKEDADVKIRAAYQVIFGELPKPEVPVVTISTGAGITPPAV